MSEAGGTSSGGGALRAQALEVVDADGNVRARLGLAPDGALALDLADAGGLIRATLSVDPGGSAARKLADEQGTYRVALGAWLDGSASLDVFDEQRNHRVSVGERPGAPAGMHVCGTPPVTFARCWPTGLSPTATRRWSSGIATARTGPASAPGPTAARASSCSAPTARCARASGSAPDVGAPAVVELYGAGGGYKVAMGEYPDGAGRLNLWDADGEPIAGLLPDPPSQ